MQSAKLKAQGQDQEDYGCVVILDQVLLRATLVGRMLHAFGWHQSFFFKDLHTFTRFLVANQRFVDWVIVDEVFMKSFESQQILKVFCEVPFAGKWFRGAWIWMVSEGSASEIEGGLQNNAPSQIGARQAVSLSKPFSLDRLSEIVKSLKGAVG